MRNRDKTPLTTGTHFDDFSMFNQFEQRYKVNSMVKQGEAGGTNKTGAEISKKEFQKHMNNEVTFLNKFLEV